MQLDTRIIGTTEKDIEFAAKIIKEGGLVAFPTETVYGLGANAMNAEAVSKVYAAKGRPSDNPMIVHIARDVHMFRVTDEITDDMQKLMTAFWPGPLTMVVPAKPEVPRVVTGGLDTVAVRMPDSQPTLDLILESGCLLVGPSANLSGHPSPTTASHVDDDLHGRIEAIIQGPDCKVGIESTVIDMTSDVPMILRPGYVTKEQLSEVLGKEVDIDPAILKKPDVFDNNGLLETDDSYQPKAPGMKYKHYAPKAEMIIFTGDPEKVRLAMAEEKMERMAFGQHVEVMLYGDKEPNEAAKEFFAQLREYDKSNVDVIFATALDEDGIGLAVMNRMFKSAGYNEKIMNSNKYVEEVPDELKELLNYSFNLMNIIYATDSVPNIITNVKEMLACFNEGKDMVHVAVFGVEGYKKVKDGNFDVLMDFSKMAEVQRLYK